MAVGAKWQICLQRQVKTEIPAQVNPLHTQIDMAGEPNNSSWRNWLVFLDDPTWPIPSNTIWRNWMVFQSLSWHIHPS